MGKTGELVITAEEALLPRAYEGRKDLTAVTVQEGVKEIPDYAFSECRNLVKAVLPQSISRLGSHAFYNCRNLSYLVVPAELSVIEDGTFKNCAALSEITFKGMRNKKNQCIRNVLFDIEQETTLTLLYEDETAVLVMPRHDYQYVANEPARIFSEISYGTGHFYRKTVNSRDVEFQEYDKLFEMAKRENNARTVSEICMARLGFPYQLNSQAARQYTEYLKENFVDVVERLIKENAKDRQALQKLCRLGNFGVMTADNIGCALAIAADQKNAEAVSWLMEYKRQHFAPQKKDFEL